MKAQYGLRAAPFKWLDGRTARVSPLHAQLVRDDSQVANKRDDMVVCAAELAYTDGQVPSSRVDVSFSHGEVRRALDDVCSRDRDVSRPVVKV